MPRDHSLSDSFVTQHNLNISRSNKRSKQWLTLAGNSALLPSDVDLVLLPAWRLLAGNSFIVRDFQFGLRNKEITRKRVKMWGRKERLLRMKALTLVGGGGGVVEGNYHITTVEQLHVGMD